MTNRVRFVSYEPGDESHNRRVEDIAEYSDRDTRKKTRRFIMTQLGKLVDNMLDDDLTAITSFEVLRLRD